MQAHLTRSTRKKKNMIESESEEPRVHCKGRERVGRRILLDSEEGEEGEEEEEEFKAIDMESEHESEDRDQEYRRLNKTKSSSM